MTVELFQIFKTDIILVFKIIAVTVITKIAFLVLFLMSTLFDARFGGTMFLGEKKK